VLDVKCGDGAFMKREEDARALAASMTSIGRALGKPVQALLTRMDEPLGRTVGNALEVKESIACLRGEGPADLMEVTLELAAEMLVVGGAAADITAARNRCRSAIADGSALDRLRRVIAAQGGEPRVCDDPDGVLPQARAVTPFLADRAGFVTRLAAWPVGQASMLLGAGRETVTSPIDPAAGIVLVRSSGDAVASGDVIAELHHDPARAASVPAALDLLRGACEIGPQPPPRRPLVIDRVA
jgi:pyrimidine-nucleoside phosphorylase/thymidine phosphorylase